MKHTADVVVTDAIEELILGIDWMANKACRWDFGRGYIELGNQWIRLRGRPVTGQVRRIYAQESVDIPSLGQVDVPVNVTWPNLRQKEAHWATEPKPLSEGVITARTSMDGNNFHAAIRIVNLSDRGFPIPKDMCLGEAHQVGVCESGPAGVHGPGIRPVTGPPTGPVQLEGGGPVNGPVSLPGTPPATCLKGR